MSFSPVTCTVKSRSSGPAQGIVNLDSACSLPLFLYKTNTFSTSLFRFLLTKSNFQNMVKKEKPRQLLRGQERNEVLMNNLILCVLGNFLQLQKLF
jgi:hypothetical protein